MILLHVGATPAATEAPRLAAELTGTGHSVEVILAEEARLFVGPSSFAAVGARVVGRASGASEAIVYFPATTGTLARLAYGLACDPSSEEGTSGLRFVVPDTKDGSADNPAVMQNIAAVERDGVKVLDDGRAGAVALEILGGLAREDGMLAGKKVVVTAGGTHERIDSVRFIGNRSSGKMGLAVAREARLMGADVTVVAANVSGSLAGVTWTDVESVSEMEVAVHEAVSGADVLVMAAAVSDFTPKSVSEGKIRRGASETMTLELAPTSDILAGMRGRYPDLVVVGFAATHGDPTLDAREKLTRKGVDFVVGNDISRSDVGFGTDENEVVIVGGESEVLVRRAAKNEVARAILEIVSRKLRVGSG